MTYVKRILVTLFTLVALALPVSAANMQAGTPSLSVVGGQNADFFQFNEKGVYVPYTDAPAPLKEGWIILSGQEPVTLQGNNITIVLQRESILSIGSTRVDDPSFYVVAGSASFLFSPSSSGNLEVSTPVGIYQLDGPGEMFVSSDYAEVIFSLGGEIQVLNAITRQVTNIPPFTYLNLADPFLHAKEISRQTYQALSINQDKEIAKILPSVSVEDGITFQSPKPMFDTPVLPAEETSVSIPFKVGQEGKMETKEIVISEVPAEGMSVTVSVSAQKPTQEGDTQETFAEGIQMPEDEKFDVHIVHTNDIRGSIENDNSIGFTRLATLLEWGREVSDRNLLLDAGNTMSGTPLANAFSGESIAVLLDMLKYDAIAPGPEDYAFGYNRLQEAAEIAKTQSQISVLAANVQDAAGNHLFTPYRLFDLEGFIVGVIGLTIPPAALYDDPEFQLEAVVNQLKGLVTQISEETDFIVVLGNMPQQAPVTPTEIASSVKGIDLIITGEAANLPAEGSIVGETVIVHAGAELSSIGIVTISVRNDEIESINPTRLSVEDIENPEQTVLASLYGITQVPENASVRTYIENQKARFTALKKPSESTPQTQEVEMSSQVQAQPETAVADALTIREPLGIVSSSIDSAESSTEWGISTSFTVSRDGITGSSTPKVGLSINPFFHRNAFSIGLQAYFLTDGSLFDPQSYSVSNISDETGIAGTVSSVMHVIDYIRYGEPDYPFYLAIDDTTPISFGNRLLVNKMQVASGPYEEHLGMYSNARIGKVNLEIFADDLYLTNWLEGKSQTGGGRLTYTFGSSFSLGASSIITANRSRSMTAYPALDLEWTLKNERKLRLDTFLGFATSLSLHNFSFDSIYNASGNDIQSMFPNFLIAGGLDMRTLKWNFRLAAAVQNSTDPLVSYGSFNQTRYSGQMTDFTRLYDVNAGVFYTFAAEAGYQGDRFGITTSWDIPVSSDLTQIVTVDGASGVSADRFAIETTYSGTHFQGAIGFRRVGMLRSFENLLSATTIPSALYEFVLSGTLEKASQPYLSLRYRSGLFGLFGDISWVRVGTTTAYTPRVNVGATITLGKSNVVEATRQENTAVALGKPGLFSGSLGSSYTRRFISGATDEHYVTVNPKISFTTENLSFGIGPKVSWNAADFSLYTHDDTPYAFGSSYGGTVGKVYDSVTDAFSLIDHILIGKEENLFYLDISRNQIVSMGSLVRNVSSIPDSTLESPLALRAKLNTKVFDVDMFLNDLTDTQLGGIRLALMPFTSYNAEFSLSAIGIPAFSTVTGHVISLMPGFGMILPIVDNQSTTLALDISAYTLVDYSSANGFSQYLLSSTGTILERFDSYLLAGGLKLKVKDFSLGLDFALHNGALSYGMFDELFARNQKDILALLASPAGSQEFSAGIEAKIEKKKFSVSGSYHLPLSPPFAPDTARDMLTLAGSLNLSWFDVELAYSRKGFLDSVDVLISGSDNLLTRAKNFLLSTESYLSAGISVGQGPLTFNATLSSLALFSPVAGSWNQQEVLGAVSPTISLGVDINLF